MDRVKRISSIVMEKYPERFSPDFENNKKVLQEIAVTRSKELRNKVAGFITSYLRKQRVVEKDVGSEVESDIEPQAGTSEEDETSNTQN
jgi:small subunit ribosomal protein S17e